MSRVPAKKGGKRCTTHKNKFDRANKADIASFLRSQGEQLERSGNEYSWKRHASLTIKENKWYRHSQSKGSGPIDFLMEFFGKSFLEAVETLKGEKGNGLPLGTQQFRLPPRGVGAKALLRFLSEPSEHLNFLCLDRDKAGNDACRCKSYSLYSSVIYGYGIPAYPAN